MSVNNFIPMFWSESVERPFRGSLAYGQPGVCNRDYEGQIQDAGDTVKIGMLSRPTIGTYTRNSNLTVQTLGDASTTLTVDQSPYFAFQVDDVDAAQARPNLTLPALDEAGYGLADSQDEYISGLYAQAGSSVGSSGSPKTDLGTAGQAYVWLTKLGQALSEMDVPKAGRWCVIPPWFTQALQIDDRTVKTSAPESQAVLKNGFVARLAGFDLLESTNVSNDATTWRIMAGTSRAITIADQLVKVEADRMENRFADVVKGLLVYGAKVVRPEALAVLYANKPS